MLYANVFPKQLKPIDFGWKNKTTEAGIFVVEPTGEIRMPKLLDYFDFTIFNVEEYHPHRAFGTRNFKSPFTMATRFLGFERAVIERPDLAPITDELYLWNKKLLQSYPFVKFFHIGDDFAGNLALFISPHDWRKWLMPEYLRLVNLARFFGQKIIFHSDGDIHEVLEDIISLGIDYLDYQPIGKMKAFETHDMLCGVRLLVNSIEEQEHKHEASMSMQKKDS